MDLSDRPSGKGYPPSNKPSEQKLWTHQPYANFFSWAIRPDHLGFSPSEGYRQDQAGNDEHEITVIRAAISRQRLMGVFLDIMGSMADQVAITLEARRAKKDGERDYFHREHIDRAVLESKILLDYQGMLLHDGHSGVTVEQAGGESTLELDDHKILTLTGGMIPTGVRILEANGIRRNDKLQLVVDKGHVHGTREKYLEQFRLCMLSLGTDSPEREGDNDLHAGTW